MDANRTQDQAHIISSGQQSGLDNRGGIQKDFKECHEKCSESCKQKDFKKENLQTDKLQGDQKLPGEVEQRKFI